MTLTAKDLTFRYQKSGRELLGRFSLTLEAGEVVGLSAPSGRGKTTLCKVLAGYERPLSGSVLLDGQPLSQFPGPCPVQLIWQHPEQAVNPRFTMAAVLREGGATDPRVAEGLQLRPDWLSRYPAELSGGELQRFCIARALGANPRFLLCDEMTAMLDLITQSQIWSFLLEEARRRQLGLLVVSHSQALLDLICTRRITLD